MGDGPFGDRYQGKWAQEHKWEMPKWAEGGGAGIGGSAGDDVGPGLGIDLSAPSYILVSLDSDPEILLPNAREAAEDATSTITLTDAGARDEITFSLPTPGTLTVATTNDSTPGHTHEVTTSACPGAAASILASTAAGYLGLVRLGLYDVCSPAEPLDVASKLKVDENGDIILLKNVTYSWPSAQAAGADYVLSNDGSGNLSWAAAAGGDVTGSGADKQVAYWTASDTISGENELWYDYTTNRLGIGHNSPACTLHPLGTSEQLRLGYDSDSYCSFTVASDSDLTIKPAESGRVVIQPTGDSATFFQVLDADGGTPIFNVDSTNERVGIGTASPDDVFSVYDKFQVGSDGDLHEIKDVTYDWPAAQAAGADYFLRNDGSGNLTWVDLSSTVFGSGADHQVAFWTAADTLSGEDNLWWDYSNNRLGILTTSPDNTFSVADKFQVDANGDMVEIKNVTYSWPSAQAAGAQRALINDGSGNLSWTAVVNGDGNAGELAFWSDSNTIDGDSALVWDATNNRLGINDSTPSFPMTVGGTSGITNGPAIQVHNSSTGGTTSNYDARILVVTGTGAADAEDTAGDPYITLACGSGSTPRDSVQLVMDNTDSMKFKINMTADGGSTYEAFHISNPNTRPRVMIGGGATPSGILHCYQGGTTRAIPPLYLEQLDVDQEIITFKGTSASNTDRTLIDYDDVDGVAEEVLIKVAVQDTADRVDGDFYLVGYSYTHSW